MLTEFSQTLNMSLLQQITQCNLYKACNLKPLTLGTVATQRFVYSMCSCRQQHRALYFISHYVGTYPKL